MENYILNLLKENSRVIIPDFGAFIIRQLNPPEIAFNSLLTFNDGILTEYISRNAKISFHDASLKVSEYSEKLNTDLKLHNRLSFNEIGWVWLDESGEKQFTPWKGGEPGQTETDKPLRDLETILKEAESTVRLENEIISDSPLIQPAEQVPFILDDTIKEVDIDATKDNLHDKSADNSITADNIPAEPFLLEEPASPEPETDNKSGLKGDTENEILIKPKVDLAETLQDYQEGKSVIGTDDDVPVIGIRFKHEMPPEETVIAHGPATSEGHDITGPSIVAEPVRPAKVEPVKPLDNLRQEIESKSNPPKKQPEKKKRAWILPVLLIGSLIILSGGAWLFFPDQVKKIIPAGKPSDVELSPDVEISSEADAETAEPGYSDEQVSNQEIIAEPEQSNTSPEPDTTATSVDTRITAKKYYIVAGRFRSQVNAENYVTTLRAKGFDAELFGTHDNLYSVSFDSFTSKESAQLELARIRKTTEPNAWILYY